MSHPPPPLHQWPPSPSTQNPSVTEYPRRAPPQAIPSKLHTPAYPCPRDKMVAFQTDEKRALRLTRAAHEEPSPVDVDERRARLPGLGFRFEDAHRDPVERVRPHLRGTNERAQSVLPTCATNAAASLMGSTQAPHVACTHSRTRLIGRRGSGWGPKKNSSQPQKICFLFVKN